MNAFRLVVLSVLLSASVAANAQSDAWHLVVDGAPTAWPAAPPLTDSLEAAAEQAIRTLQRDGYYLASVDSAVVGRERTTLFVRRGPRVEVGRVEVMGATTFDTEALRARMETRLGTVLDPDVLRADLDEILARYERSGYPLAEADVETALTGRDPPTLALTVRISEGERLALRGLDLVPAGRTDPSFAARTAGLEPGGPLDSFEPGRIRRALEATGLFETVGAPELALGEEGATIRVPVTEAPPGQFDLVIGYLPPPTAGASGSVVGNGQLALRNLFGRGRSLDVQLVRNPGLVSSVDVRAADPLVLGLPLRVEGAFSGYQQDSTFQRQRFGAEVGYRIAPGLEALGTLSREFVDAGVAGAVLVDGRQRIPEADAWFAGVGIAYLRTDARLNPRRGFALRTTLEQGVKRRDLSADTSDVASPVSVRQQRLFAEGRFFIPTVRRQLIAVGLGAAVLLGEVYDDSDLFRFGGATSLRGYEEEQFRGNLVGRALVEYRLQIDRTSYAFLFTDVGYISRPETAGIEAEDFVRPGYGFGLQYATPLGLIAVSYALNPDDGPTRGKVHVGLSVGL